MMVDRYCRDLFCGQTITHNGETYNYLCLYHANAEYHRELKASAWAGNVRERVALWIATWLESPDFKEDA